MKAETVEVVRERERELFPSKISFISGAIKIKYMAKSKKDGLSCGKIRKKLILLYDNLSFL